MELLLKGRPDTDREDPRYLSGMIEMLSYLTDEEMAWITDPREGVQTRCKFLPTPADVHELIREKRARLDAVSLPRSTWKTFKPDFDADKPLPESERERRAKVVFETLGYNPVERRKDKTFKRELTEPTAEDIANLKTPKATKCDLTPQLRALLEKEGWPFIPSEYPPSQQKDVAA
jgi:hypothetical protein